MGIGRTDTHKLKAAKPKRVEEGATSLRAERKKFIRDRIVAAALDSFQQAGFQNTSVERIVELAGTTAPTFYRHFSSKSDLLIPLQGHLEREARECLELLDEAHVASKAAMGEWIGQYLSMWTRNRLLIQAYWEAVGGRDTKRDLTSRVLPRMLSFSDVAVDRLAAHFPPGRIEKMKRRLDLFMLSLDRVAFVASIAKSEEAAAELVSEFAEIMWEGLFDHRGA